MEAATLQTKSENVARRWISLRTVWSAALGVAVLLSASTHLYAQTKLPNMGDAGAMSVVAERRIGERIARELYRDPEYIDDPVLVDYVQSIWQPLLVAARQRGELVAEMDARFAWQVLLAKDRSVNAFALPGAYLGVHLGMLGVVDSRDELAAVLAHELSHVTQRHISRMVESENKKMPLMIASMVLGALVASKNSQAGAAIMTTGQAAAAQGQLNFSRDMEREADRVGYGVMVQAGFNPQGFVHMFEKLQQANRLNDNGNYPYLRSHPLTSERMADMQARHQINYQSETTDDSEVGLPAVQHARSVKPFIVPSAEDALIAARARVLSQTDTSALREWSRDPDVAGWVTKTSKEKVVAYYVGALSALRLQMFARAQALQLKLQLALRSDDNKIERARVAKDTRAIRLAELLGLEIALRSGADIAMAQTLANLQTPQGAAQLNQLMESGKRPELFLAVQWALRDGQSEALAKVAQKLQAWVTAYPRDANAWQKLASVWSATKQPLRAIRAEAEEQLAQLDLAAALDRLKAAQNMAHTMAMSGNPVDHIEASIIDARTREVQSLYNQQQLDDK